MRAVIGEDAVLLRVGLVRVLEEAGEQVVAAVGDAPALVDAVTRLSPDVTIADIRMPPGMTDDGLRATIELRTRRPDTAVLVFSQYVEQAYTSELLATGSVGLGYLLKDRVADVGQFVEAVRTSRPVERRWTRRSSRNSPRSNRNDRSHGFRRANGRCSVSWRKGGATRPSPDCSSSATVRLKST